jgi:hypothetical protein
MNRKQIIVPRTCPTCGYWGNSVLRAGRGGRTRVPSDQVLDGTVTKVYSRRRSDGGVTIVYTFPRRVRTGPGSVRVYWPVDQSRRFRVCPDPWHNRIRRRNPKGVEPAPTYFHKVDPERERRRTRRHRDHQSKARR